MSANSGRSPNALGAGLENVPEFLLPLDGALAVDFAAGTFVFPASPLAFSFDVASGMRLLDAHLLRLRPCTGLCCR